MFNDRMDRLDKLNKLRRFGPVPKRQWHRVWIVALILTVGVAVTYGLAEMGL